MRTRSAKDTGLNRPRRNLLKAAAAGMFAGMAAPLLQPLHLAHAAEGSLHGKKALIVFYSRSGNTRALARQLQTLTRGELVELETVQPYPEEYRALTEQARRELASGFKPPLKTKINNIQAYDVIFVGSPNWWGTVAAPVRAFLSEYDLSGKTVAPFITHEGSALGRSMADIRTLCPQSTVVEGLAVRGSRAASARAETVAWLRKIGMKE
ncbi:flavodoxin [Desulfovibrio sp. ZJ200]|uniref:flavodoxin n=1 Tax=Desulfovibrio sp. ZJ200 TaxID=2709792 RepID=UPI0013EA6BC7|nr:flavodoxin [Desulfovibrio sp. ZJ200]